MGTFIVTAILVGIVAWIIRKIIKDKKNDKHTCCGDCGHCGGCCH